MSDRDDDTPTPPVNVARRLDLPPPAPPAKPEPTAEEQMDALAPVRLTGRDRMAAKQRTMDKPRQPLPLDDIDLRPSKPTLREIDAAIQREMDEAMSAELTDDPFAGVDFSPGRTAAQKGVKAPPSNRKVGTVVSVRGNDIFVDIPGSRSQGVINRSQFPEGAPAVGQPVEALVDRFDAANGLLILTRQGQAVEADWSTLAQRQVVEARVTGEAKNADKKAVGLNVEINGIRGFLPISQLELYRVETLEPYLNQRILCMVTELDKEDRRLVVSRRELLEQEREQLREKLWLTLEEGQVHEGTVRLVKPFGAFVDIGGADGLLPAGEMAWTRVADPTSVVQPGQRVKVIVRRLDRDARKITLSLRDLLDNPWDTLGQRHPERSLVTGQVTRIMEFGAFVEVEPGVEGLVHISELAAGRVRRVEDVVKVGQEVTAVVLRIERDAKRVALSIREAERMSASATAAAQAAAAPAAEPAAEEEPDAPKAPRVRKYELKGGTGSGGPLFPGLVK